MRSYRRLGTGEEPIAIIFGKVENQTNVPLRVHDQCFTSEVLGEFCFFLKKNDMFFFIIV